jgi:hypothetical protein
MDGQSTPVDTSTNESQSDQVTLLLNQLGSYERAPKRLLDSWQATNDEVNSTARIFLDEGGFVAWFAYFLTRNAAQSQNHFAGKAGCNRLISSLEDEPAASRKRLAARVAAAVQPEIEKKISSLYDKRIKPLQNGDLSQRSNKRRRKYILSTFSLRPSNIV